MTSFRPRGRRRWLPAVLVLGLAAAACRPAPRPQRHDVILQGMAFQPAALTVSPGDTIAWINHDIVPHTATGHGFDTGAIGPDSVARHVVTAADTGRYACTFHPTMTAELHLK